MTKKTPLFAVTAAAIALVLGGCEDLLGTDDMDGDDMPTPVASHRHVVLRRSRS